MARLEGVSARNAGLFVRLASFFTRRKLARLSGRSVSAQQALAMVWCVLYLQPHEQVGVCKKGISPRYIFRTIDLYFNT